MTAFPPFGSFGNDRYCRCVNGHFTPLIDGSHFCLQCDNFRGLMAIDTEKLSAPGWYYTLRSDRVHHATMFQMSWIDRRADGAMVVTQEEMKLLEPGAPLNAFSAFIGPVRKPAAA